MKKQFFDYMFKVMEQNKDIVLIFCGLGWPRIEQFIHNFPGRAVNTEASEQTALDIAVGLSYSGKIPVVYTISTFYWRAAETLRTYVDHENLHICLIGAGVNEEYGQTDGFSHSATDIHELFDIFTNFKQCYPETIEGLESDIDAAILNNKPNFINIHK